VDCDQTKQKEVFQKVLPSCWGVQCAVGLGLLAIGFQLSSKRTCSRTSASTTWLIETDFWTAFPLLTRNLFCFLIVTGYILHYCYQQKLCNPRARSGFLSVWSIGHLSKVVLRLEFRRYAVVVSAMLPANLSRAPRSLCRRFRTSLPSRFRPIRTPTSRIRVLAQRLTFVDVKKGLFMKPKGVNALEITELVVILSHLNPYKPSHLIIFS
jgi:hypothetical protein